MRKHGEKDIPPFYISNKDRPTYLGLRFRIIVNSIIVNNFASVKTFSQKS